MGKELKINDQFSLYQVFGTLYELHDFYNLCFLRQNFTKDEIEEIKINPSEMFNYYDLI